MNFDNINSMRRIAVMIAGAPGIAIIYYNLWNAYAWDKFNYFPYRESQFYALLFAVIFGIFALFSALEDVIRLDRKISSLLYMYMYGSYLYLACVRFDFTKTDTIERSRNYFIITILFFIGTIIIGIGHKIMYTEGILKGIKDLYVSPHPVIVFIISLFIYVLFAFNFIFPQVGFLGDEPHYLLVTHSLVYDKDINVKNNYMHQDYQKYADGKLKIQAVFGKKGVRQLYSIHMPMISIVLVPFYWIGTHWGQEVLIFCIRFGMSLIAALLGVAFYLLVRKEFSLPVSWKVWAVFSLLPPLFFYSRQVYPETAVALLSVVAYTLILRGHRIAPSLLAGLLPFFGSKYLAISIGFLLVFLKDMYRKKEFSKAYRYAGWVLVIILFLAYLQLMYGYNVPIAQYQGKTGQGKVFEILHEYLFGVDWQDRIGSVFSYFLDQRDGLLPYVPIYFFSFLGMIWAFRRSSSRAWDMFLIALPYIGVYAFLTHRGGFCPPARPLVAIVWIFAYFLGYFYEYNKNELFRYLSYASIVISIIMLGYLVAHPMAAFQATTHNITERGSILLIAFSNFYIDLPLYFPSFLKVEGAYWIPNFIWIALLVLVIWYYARITGRDQEIKLTAGIIQKTAIILFIIGLIQFSCIPQLSLRGVPFAEIKDRNIRVYFFQKQIFIDKDMNFNYHSSRQLPILVESKAKLESVKFHFNKPEDLNIKIHYFEKSTTPFFNDDTNIISLTSYRKGKSSYYYMISLEPLCQKGNCPFGFNIEFF